MPDNALFYQTQIDGGHHWSFFARRGNTITLRDLTGNANVGMLFYNSALLNEKYNAPDTLKCQHTFQLTAGHCLFSDMGRVFCSIIADTFGAHDTVSGNINAKMVAERWQPRSYQQQRNDWLQNGHDSFLVELAKYELNIRHMAANVNWFSHVVVDDAGNMSLQATPSQDKELTLRVEMDTLIVLHTCPHPLDQSETYPQSKVQIELAKADPLAPDDLCLNHCEENRRGFANNALYHMEPFYD